LPKVSNNETLQAYVDYLNVVFNQTITDSHLVLLQKTSLNFLITCFQDDNTRPLELKPESWLHFRQVVTIQPFRDERKVIVKEGTYRYSLSPNLRDEDKWIFRYDYELKPPKEHIPHCHLHLNANKGGEKLGELHFPTGRVSIEQIIAHLISVYKIQSKRTDWLDYLGKSHKEWMQKRRDIISKRYLFP
jgi:hypothetical protein